MPVVMRIADRTVPVFGFQPSRPPSTFAIVYSLASASVSLRPHATRAVDSAPGPLESYSA